MAPRHDGPQAAGASAIATNRPDIVRTWLAVTLGGVALALLVYRALVLTPGRLFDIDEFEHLQASWLMGRGLVPYRDFFEHHPPLLYVLLASVRDLPDAAGKLFAARYLMVPFSAGILALTWWPAAKHGGRVAGAIACALVSTLMVFQQKVVEIRPDVPALFLLLVAVALQSGKQLSLRRLTLIGIALGSALLFTPKLIFAVPAFAFLAMPRDDERSSAWRRLLALGAGVALPVSLVALWLQSHGALEKAVFFNTTFNSAVPYTFQSAYLSQSIGRSFQQNTLFWIAAAAAILVAAASTRWSRTVESRSHLVIVAAAAGLGAGLLLIPVPLQQYLMAVSAMFAIVAGVQSARLIAVARDAGRVPHALVLGLVALIILHPVPTLVRAHHDSNQPQLAALRHMWANVPPETRVFDCWTGLGLFRRPAYYYGFLGPDIIGALATLDAHALDANLIQSLISHRPVIISDPQIASLPPSVTAYIEMNYMPESSGMLLLPYRHQD